MDRDTSEFDRRVAAKLATRPKRRWPDRRDFPPGTAGYLYGQVRTLLAGLENLSGELSATATSDLEFGAPRITGAAVSPSDASVSVIGEAPVTRRKPPDSVVFARMGTALMAGMTASFACEVGLKAILVTRLDEAERTHDLLDLYEALPPDSRARLEADYPHIAGVLERYRHSFGKWRYFEENVGADAMLSLVNTDRVWELSEAVRVIVDECVIAGLKFDVDIEREFNGQWDGNGSTAWTSTVGLSLTSREAAIPWDAVLAGDGD